MRAASAVILLYWVLILDVGALGRLADARSASQRAAAQLTAVTCPIFATPATHMFLTLVVMRYATSLFQRLRPHELRPDSDLILLVFVLVLVGTRRYLRLPLSPA